jgi:hypothetical protein
MDRQEVSMRELKSDFNARFDGVKLHLDRQDEKLDRQDQKLDLLLQRNAREDGAGDAKKAWLDRSVSYWTIIGAAFTAIAVAADMGGRWIWSLIHGGH